MRACRDGRDRDAKSAFSPGKKRSARTGRAAFARAQTSGTMRTKQTRRAGAAGTRPKSDGLPYVNPLHLIGACRAAIDVSRRANNDRPVHFFRAEARRRDARRAAVRGRATRSRAADALRARVAESSATSSAPARGDAREHTPIAASSCRVARGKISSLRENLISTRENLMRRVSLSVLNKRASPFVSSFSQFFSFRASYIALADESLPPPRLAHHTT